MRTSHAAVAAASLLLLAAGSAKGQGPGPEASPRRYKPTPLNLQKKQVGTEAMADVGRTRMRAGDCEGAITAFDDALLSVTNPSVHRDRGLCHEKLGHPYPAIDDYRAYLTDAPDAPDADDIRERLSHLEGETGGPQPSKSEDTDAPEGLRAHTSVSVGSGSAIASENMSEAGGGSEKDEASAPAGSEDDALDTPLARGTGFSLGPFVSFHKWLIGSSSLSGDPQYGSMLEGGQSFSEAIGADFRYSFGPHGSLVFEAGFEHFNATSNDPATANGLTSQVAYELRLPLSPAYKGQFTVAPGLGYEHLALSPSDPQTAPQSYGAFVPRVRLGYRYLFVPSVGLDLSADVGVSSFFLYSKFPYDSASSATMLLALHVGLLWGL